MTGYSDRSKPPTSADGRDGPRARVSIDDVRRARAGTLDSPTSSRDAWSSDPFISEDHARSTRAESLNPSPSQGSHLRSKSNVDVEGQVSESVDSMERPLAKSSMADMRRTRADSFGIDSRRRSNSVSWPEEARVGLPLRRRPSALAAPIAITA